METKQVIVVRKDLNMRRGKEAAQVAHASMGAILSLCHVGQFMDAPDQVLIRADLSDYPAVEAWLNGSFTKVVVSVDSEEELMQLHRQAVMAALPCSLIRDNGKTEFRGCQTYTALAIGPGFADEIDAITGHLKLR